MTRTATFLLRKPGQTQGFREHLNGAPPLTMLWLPPGRFRMGSPPDEQGRGSDEGPQHEVQLQGFFISQTPISQAQWREVATWQEQPGEHWRLALKANPSQFCDQADSDQRPVERVSWHEAREFCQRLHQRTGRPYRLPSEAEWEYACRAGSSMPFHFGATITTDLANYNGNYSYGNGPKGEFRKETTTVGIFPANGWGLHDMHGNVWEWCQDQWHQDYSGAPADGSAWEDKLGSDDNEQNNNNRLLRGGSWDSLPVYCRSARRIRGLPDFAISGVGFRVVCLPQGPSLNP